MQLSLRHNVDVTMRYAVVAALLSCAALADAQVETPPPEGVDLLDEQVASRSLINCERSGDKSGTISTKPEVDSLIDFALDRPTDGGGPRMLELTLKIASDTELDEYIAYWVHEGESQWKEFVRVPIQPDGETHTYLLPLHATAPLKAVRLALGKNGHAVQLQSARLYALPTQLPASLAAGKAESPQVVELTRGSLTLRADLQANQVSIHDQQTGRIWRSEPINSLLLPCRLEKLDENTLLLAYYDVGVDQPVDLTIELDDASVVRFTASPHDPSVPLSGARFLPPRFTTDMQQGRIVFCDRSCGVLLDQVDTTYASWPLRVYGNTNCLDMPWVGLFDNARGDGVMLLIETPADAEVAMIPDLEGRHWPETRWLASLDTSRYPRSVSLQFTADGRHVALAKRYREHLQEQGRFRTLSEKALEKPAVERLRGAPALWGGRYPTKFIRQMRPLGIDRGVVNTCQDPGLVQWLNDQGYLTGRYDSYTDFTEGPTAFQSDDVQATAIVSRPGGQPKLGWKKRSGEQMFWRSSACWEQAQVSYTPQDLEKLPYNARFIDVAAAAELMEDYHPEHTFDRRQDLENRRAMFHRMNEHGLVLGTEHGNDWAADLVEYFEGTMSGPFWWSSWPAGYLDRPTKDQLAPQYLKYGMGFANRVPLWELVFHDCANTTWYWGDTAGLLYEAAPDLSDRKDLFNLLYGTTPLFWMNNTGYRLPDEVHRMLRTFHDTCQFQKQVAFEQLTDHEFLSDDGAVQRTRFANGAVVVVNFSDQPREYTDQDKTIVLAPRGYHAESPGYQQSRTIVDGDTQTLIKFPGYLAVESPGEHRLSGVKGPGRLTALRVDDNTWNVFTDPDIGFEVDVLEVTGWDATDSVAIHFMDDLGEVHGVLERADAEGIVRFRSFDKSWRFALVRTPGEKEAL